MTINSNSLKFIKQAYNIHHAKIFLNCSNYKVLTYPHPSLYRYSYWLGKRINQLSQFRQFDNNTWCEQKQHSIFSFKHSKS